MFASVQLWFVIFLLPTISIASFQPFFWVALLYQFYKYNLLTSFVRPLLGTNLSSDLVIQVSTGHGTQTMQK